MVNSIANFDPTLRLSILLGKDRQRRNWLFSFKQVNGVARKTKIFVAVLGASALLWQDYRGQHPDDGYGYSRFCDLSDDAAQPDQIAHGFVIDVRHPDGRQFASSVKPRKHRGVTTIGLHPVAGLGRN